MKILDSNITQAPEFVENLPPVLIMKTINDSIDKLRLEPTKETLELIEKELNSLEIITVGKENINLWMISPIQLEIQTIKRNLLDRLKKYIKNNELKSSRVKRETVTIDSKIETPMKVNIDSEDYREIIRQVPDEEIAKKITEYLISLTFLKHLVFKTMKKRQYNIGVFKKPFAITNINRLNLWLKEQKLNKWSNEYSLKTISLKEMIDSAIIVPS